MDPFGGAALDELHCFGNRERRGQRQQDVDVVHHAADFDGFHVILPSDAAQIRPEPFLESRWDQGPALLGTEDAMIIGADVRHAPHSAVPAGLIQGRTCAPNVETLDYCRQVPPGQIHAGLIPWTASSTAPPRPGAILRVLWARLQANSRRGKEAGCYRRRSADAHARVVPGRGAAG